jgi:hypothetical protein
MLVPIILFAIDVAWESDLAIVDRYDNPIHIGNQDRVQIDSVQIHTLFDGAIRLVDQDDRCCASLGDTAYDGYTRIEDLIIQSHIPFPPGHTPRIKLPPRNYLDSFYAHGTLITLRTDCRWKN